MVSLPPIPLVKTRARSQSQARTEMSSTSSISLELSSQLQIQRKQEEEGKRKDQQNELLTSNTGTGSATPREEGRVESASSPPPPSSLSAAAAAAAVEMHATPQGDEREKELSVSTIQKESTSISPEPTPRLHRISIRIPLRTRSVVSLSPIPATGAIAVPKNSAAEVMLPLVLSKGSSSTTQIKPPKSSDISIQEEAATSMSSENSRVEENNSRAVRQEQPDPLRSNPSSMFQSQQSILPPSCFELHLSHTLIAARIGLLRALRRESRSLDRLNIGNRRWKFTSTYKALKHRTARNGALIIEQHDRIKAELGHSKARKEPRGRYLHTATNDVKANDRQRKVIRRRHETSLSEPLEKIRDMWRFNLWRVSEQALHENDNVSMDNFLGTDDQSALETAKIVGSTRQPSERDRSDDGWGLMVEEDSEHQTQHDFSATPLNNRTDASNSYHGEEQLMQTLEVVDAMHYSCEPGQQMYSDTIAGTCTSVPDTKLRRESVSLYWKRKAAKARGKLAGHDNEGGNAEIENSQVRQNVTSEDYHASLQSIAGMY